MALRAKAALAHSSPIKPGSRALSGGAKMAQNHDRKVATLCHFPSPSRASGQPGPQAEYRLSHLEGELRSL
jgi:hypothetical protein